ncbi:CsgG/HfaB family protein [Luteolibacter sp. Populi]|uniref:CsgG/HfaB family protein n=1 Tax=Luteolibacter sp. Populi TaxID=3230487 RepID=UPI0034667BF9
MPALLKAIVLASAALVFANCAPRASTSSGFHPGGMRATLPPGVPRKVGVVIGGDRRMAGQMSDELTAKLFQLGFEVVERHRIDPLLTEYAMAREGYLDPAASVKLGRVVGAEGMFVGTITWERSPGWADSHLNLRLVDVKTSRVLWTANVHDPRTFGTMAPEASVGPTSGEAIKLIKKDLGL